MSSTYKIFWSEMVLTFKDRLSLNALSIVLLFVSSNSSLSKGTKCAPKNNGNTEFPEIAIGNRAIISDSENVTNLISTTSTAQSEKIEKIQISEDIEILENDEKFLKIPDNGRRRDGPVGQLELICSASYPVQWGFRLYQVNWIFSTYFYCVDLPRFLSCYLRH